MTTRIFKVDPKGDDLELDFSVNLPVDIFRAFAVFKNQKAVHSQASDLSNPVGIPDYVVDAEIASGGILSCRFDCFGSVNLIGQLLRISISVKQGGNTKQFDLREVKMKDYKGNFSQTRKDAWIEIRQVESN